MDIKNKQKKEFEEKVEINSKEKLEFESKLEEVDVIMNEINLKH